MKVSWSRFLACSLVCFGLCQGGVFADNPFGDETVNAPVQTQTGSRGGEATPPPITETLAAVRGSNVYAPGDYQGYTVSYGIIKATIRFDDPLKDAERLVWFQQILSEHGVKTLKLDQKQNQTGNIFNRKKWLTVTAEIEGRGFVLKAIKDYYGGTLTGNPDGCTPANDPALKALVDLELTNRTAELAILQASFEIDKLMVERSKLGLLDLSGKSRIDKAIKELKETKIPAEKAKIAATNEKVRQGLSDLAQKALEAKQYQRVIDLVNLGRDGSPTGRMQVGDAYVGLKQYDKAIEQYKTLTGVSGYAEKAELGIADASHLKGDDRAALDAIYRTLANFRNSPEELAALARVDQWKVLDRPADFPEAAGNLSKIYIQKGLLNAGPAHSTAVDDYQRAVGIRAGSGNKAEASRQILAEYAQVKSQYQAQLTSAQQAAGSDFDTRRERARGQYEAWRQSYNQAVTRARTDYDYDLRAKRRALDDAKSELDYLLRNPPAKPSTGGTDPYGTGSNGNSGTDPFSGGSGTDPYSRSTTTKTGSTTDPYGNGASGNSGTDPYDGGNGGSSGTDPYETATREYQDRLAAARAKVDRLNREYSWLYYNEDSYVADKTASERASLDSSRAEYERYDLANRPAYIANNGEVRKYSSLVAESDQRLTTLKGLAKEAGY
ncbi:MAG: hypothetical protein GX442_08285 [Candidatus Riflebacteria bacterium]|nr:hypothetical protein [Candidatus Riflebacteria bacterium]